MQNNNINTGVIFEEPKETDWVAGGVSGSTATAVIPDGKDWLDFQRPEETQKNKNFDSFSCVTYASLKSLSYYMKVVHGLDMDFSERFTAVMSGTTPGKGNTVRAVLESIRLHGFVLESDYPSMTPEMTQSQWFQDPPERIKQIGLKNSKEWKIEWEVLASANMFVPDVDHGIIITGQKRGVPICIGYAWASEYEVYYDYGYPSNHCFTVPSKKVVSPKADLKADDSYPMDWGLDVEPDANYLKELAKTYSIKSAHLITATPIGSQPLSLITKFNKVFKNLKGYMDEHGLHIFYIDNRGKQEIKLTTMAENALFMAYIKEGVIPTTSWPAIAKLPNFKFF